MNRLFALAALGVSLAALDCGAINKCVDKDGKTTYQEGACPQDAKADVIRAPAPAAEPESAAAEKKPAGAPPADGDKEDHKMQVLVETLAHYEICTLDAAFARTYGTTFGNWRTRNAALFQRLDGSPRYQAALESARNTVKVQAAKSIDRFNEYCLTQFGPAVEKNYGK